MLNDGAELLHNTIFADTLTISVSTILGSDVSHLSHFSSYFGTCVNIEYVGYISVRSYKHFDVTDQSEC